MSFKRILALVLALTMCFSIALPGGVAFADGEEGQVVEESAQQPEGSAGNGNSDTPAGNNEEHAQQPEGGVENGNSESPEGEEGKGLTRNVSIQNIGSEDGVQGVGGIAGGGLKAPGNPSNAAIYYVADGQQEYDLTFLPNALEAAGKEYQTYGMLESKVYLTGNGKLDKSIALAGDITIDLKGNTLTIADGFAVTTGTLKITGSGTVVKTGSTFDVPAAVDPAYSCVDRGNGMYDLAAKIPVYFKVDGAVVNTVYVENGGNVAEPDDPEKTGYDFDAWLDSAGNEYNFNQSVYSSIVLTASWDAIDYEITYELDGGELPEGVTNPTKYTIESETFNLPTPEREGYIFTGWTLADEAPSTTVTIAKGTSGDLTYTAHWALAIAEVGGVKYTSLAAAIEAVEENAEIVLVKDTSESLSVAAGKKITLDLGDKTLTVDPAGDNAYIRGELTIAGSGNVIVKPSNITISTGGKLTVQSGTFSATGDYLFYLAGGELVINGGSFTGAYNIVNCYADGNLALGGKVTIKGGNFLVTGADPVYPGTVVMGYENSTVSISGGIFNVQNGATAVYVGKGSLNAGVQYTAASAAISGGTFNAPVEAGDDAALSISGGTFNALVAACDNAEMNISSGTFNTVIESYDDAVVTASSNTLPIDGDSKWVALGTNPETYKLVAKDYVAQVNDGAKYESLQDAVDVAQDGDMVKLLKDVTEAVVNSNAHNFTIDLNGKTWSSNSDVLATTAGTITINATNGGVMTTEAAECCAVWAKGGNVIINAGEFISKDNKEATIYVSNANSTVTINGGTFRNTAEGAYAYGASLKPLTLNVWNSLTDSQHLVVNGGTFYGNDPQLGDDNLGAGTVGGKFVSSGHVARIDGNDTFTVIEGGLVTFDSDGGSKVEAQRIAKGGTVEKPTDPTRANFVFGGWSDGTKVWNFDNDTVTADVALTAQWTTAVASITRDETTTYYKTLAAAVAAANSGDTIKLLEDVNLANDPLTDGGYAAIAPAGKTITLDLNGKAVSGGALDVYGTLIIDDSSEGKLGSVTASGQHAVWVNNTTSSLTIKAGTITGGTGYAVVVDNGSASVTGGTVKTGENGTGAIKLQNSGSLSVSGGKVESTVVEKSAIDASNHSTVELSGGEISSIDYGVSVFGNTQLTVSGNAQITAEDGFGVCTNGNAGNAVTINVQGGSITGGDAGIYQPSGTVNVTGGSITGDTGIFVRGGTLIIPANSTATISGTGEKALPAFAPSGDGASGTGEAVTIVNSNYPNPITGTTIAGGTFTSDKANAIGSYAINDQLTPLKNFVSGGKFSTPVDPDCMVDGKLSTTTLKQGDYYYVVDAKTVTFNAGGEQPFAEVKVPAGEKVAKPTAPTSPVAFFKSWQLNGADYDFDSAVTADITLEATWTDAVAQIGNTPYASLAAAVAAVPANTETTIKMLANDDSLTTYQVIGQQQQIILDLNGKTITSTGGGFDVYGKLTITDTSENKDGKIAAQRQGVFVDAGGEFRMEAGNIVPNEGFYAIRVEANAKATMTGGWIDGEGSGIFNEGEVLITGGAMIYAHVAGLVNRGTATVSGKAQVIGDSYSVDNTGTFTLQETGGNSPNILGCFYAHGSSITNIKGGVVYNERGFAIATNGTSDTTNPNHSSNAVINIRGGQIASDSEAAVYIPAGTFNVTGGTIIGSTGIFMRGGTLNIPADSAAVITGTGAKQDPSFAETGDGANSTGDAVAIVASGYPAGLSADKITIEGGTFNSENGAPIATYAQTEAQTPVVGFVSGGTFNKDIADAVVVNGKTALLYGEVFNLGVLTVALDKTEDAGVAGNTLTLEAITNGDLTGGEVVWTSSDTNVATVANGVVTLVANGTANITATYHGVTSAACAVNVTSALASITKSEGEQAVTTFYASLRDAIAAAQDGDTVKLLATDEVSFATGGIIIDKNLTIDGNGQTVKGLSVYDVPNVADMADVTDENVHGFYIKSGNVTIKDLTMTQFGDADFVNKFGMVPVLTSTGYTGTLTLNNVNIDKFNRQAVVINGGSFSIIGGTFTGNAANKGVGFDHFQQAIEIRGGSGSISGVKVRGGGSNLGYPGIGIVSWSTGTVTLNNVDVDFTGIGVEADYNALTITGENTVVKGSEKALFVEDGGTLNVQAGSYTGAVAVDANANSKIVVSDGEFSISVNPAFMAAGKLCTTYLKNERGNYYVVDKIVVTFTNGQDVQTINVPKGEKLGTQPETPSSTTQVFDGWFDGETKYTADTVFEENTDYVAEWTDAVAQIGDTPYATLAEAVAAAGTEATVVELIASTRENITIANNQSITLNLADGVTLTNDPSKPRTQTGYGMASTIVNFGTLTVTGSGTVDNVTNGAAALYNGVNATATLNGGTFKRSAEAGTTTTSSGGNSWYVICNHGAMTVNSGVTVTDGSIATARHGYSSLFENGYQNSNVKNQAEARASGEKKLPTLTINSGLFNGGQNTVKNDDYATLTINGGTFQNYVQACVLNWNNATIKGGDFNSGAYAVLNGSFGPDSGDQGVLVIEGGNFNSGEGYTVIGDMSQSYSGTTIGSITANINTLSLPAGYAWAKVNENVYEVVEAVAKIGTKGYATLADAIAAANAGDTIELLRNLTLSEVAMFSENKNLTLDLGEFTLSSSVPDNDAGTRVLTVEAGSLIITNGQINGRVNAYDAGTLTIGATATVNGTVIVWGDGTYGAAGCKTPTLNVYGTILSSNYQAISTNGTDKSGAIINIVGGTVTADGDIGIYLPSGNLTVEGGKITGTTAVYAKSGSVEINGGELVGNGAKADYSYNGNGGNATGDALVVDNCGYPNGAPVVTISGGTFTSTKAKGIGSYCGGGVTALAEVTAYSNEISIPEDEKWVAQGTNPETYLLAAREYVAQVGEVKYETLADAIAAIKATENKTGTITLLKDVTESTVAINGGAKITLDLNENVLNTDFLYVINGELTLSKGSVNGDGYFMYVYSSDDSSKDVGSYSKLVIDDAIVNGDVVLWGNNNDGSKGYGAQIDVNEEGLVNGCVFVSGNITAGNDVVNIRGTINNINSDIGVALNGFATVNVYEHAEIEAKDASGNGTGIEVRSGTLNVTGGTIKGNGTYSFTPNGSGTTSTGVGVAVAQHTTQNNIKVTISGGDITGTVALAIANPQRNEAGELTVSVEGGNFTGTQQDTVVKLEQTETRVNAFISGGTYSAEPDEDYIVPEKKAYEINPQTGRYGITDTVYRALNAVATPVGNVTAQGDDEQQGAFKERTKVTVSVENVGGYAFLGWFNGDELVSSDLTYEFEMPTSANGEAYDLTAKFSVNSTNYSLTVTADTFTVKNVDVPSAYYNNFEQEGTFMQTVPGGTKFQVKYTGDKQFLYWRNDSDKIVSTNKEYTFELVSNTKLEAVVRKANSQNSMVYFVSQYEQVLSAFNVNQTVTEAAIVVPTAPVMPGYTFNGWLINGDETPVYAPDQVPAAVVAAVQSAPGTPIKVTPKFTRDAAEVTITYVVDGRTNTSPITEAGWYSSTAAEVGAATGKPFMYWTDEAGNILSYNTKLVFYASGTQSAKYIAVYGDDEVVYDSTRFIYNLSAERQVIGSVVNGKYVANVVSIHALPEDYTVVEFGTIFTTNSTIGESGPGFNLDTAGKSANTTAKIVDAYTFTASIGNVGTKVYFRGYVVYKDANNVEQVAYSDMQFVVYEAD